MVAVSLLPFCLLPLSSVQDAVLRMNTTLPIATLGSHVVATRDDEENSKMYPRMKRQRTKTGTRSDGQPVPRSATERELEIELGNGLIATS